MTIPPRKTHTEARHASIAVSRLADYMAASEQSKRSIVSSCKYRPIARVIQHNDAKGIISHYLRTARGDKGKLAERLEALRNKLCDGQFEEEVRDNNCDYVARFSSIQDEVELPDATLARPMPLETITLNGVRISFRPDLLISRVTRTNKARIGSMMLRYAKNKPLREEVGLYQSAFAFGYLSSYPYEEAATVERALCITLDAQSGAVYAAPGNAGYRYKEMEAACASIFERWPNIPPPKNAVL